MKKGIREMVALVVTITSLIYNVGLNPVATTAYAETKIDKPYLRSIYLSEGDNLNFTKNQYTYIVDVNNDIEELYMRVKPENENNTIKINDMVMTKDMNYKYIADLDYGRNKFNIEITDKNNNKSLYTVYVYRGGEKAVYLDDITIDDKEFGFNPTTLEYNLELDDTDELVKLDAFKKEGKYEILANEKPLVDGCMKLKFKGVGKYTITILVKDLDTGREGSYIVNIYLGIPVSPDVTNSINAVLKPNKWVMVNGRWRYNDFFGVPLKDTWYYDRNYQSYFHFNDMGNMQTGWIEDKGDFYYLDDDGKMQTGWILDEDKWYYLDENGVMRTGWRYIDNKWYYLNEDGSMRQGWFIDKDKWYYLNKDGSMAKNWFLYKNKWYYFDDINGDMKTGWLQDKNEWYYLNEDGSMKSGEWFHYKDKWYYINYVGNMRRGWLYQDGKFYYLNEDGSMQTEPKDIGGNLYKFNEDGSVITEIN